MDVAIKRAIMTRWEESKWKGKVVKLQNANIIRSYKVSDCPNAPSLEGLKEILNEGVYAIEGREG